MIKSTANGLLVTGTDLDIYSTTFVPGQVSKRFSAIVDANKLKTTLDRIKDAQQTNLTLDGETLTATVGKIVLTLSQPYDEEDFPIDPGFRAKLKQSNACFTVPSSLLSKVLTSVEFAISEEETRYYLNGIYICVDPKSKLLSFVSTDGHRLARYEIDCPEGAEAMPDAGVIVPTKTVRELHRLLKRKGCPADTFITITDTGVSFTIGEDETIESKVVDATFPDYKRHDYRMDNVVDCIEVQPHLAHALEAENVYSKVLCADFLAVTPDLNRLYDRVVMNPPFDRERDIDHVVHALKFLKPDGRLIAIMSAGTEFRQTAKAIAFRKLMQDMGATWRDLPHNSFSEVGTNVNTGFITVRKNGTPKGKYEPPTWPKVG
nr:uncharacterized protein LOC111423400 [Onthophagus taurus]